MYQQLHFTQLETRRHVLREELALARARWGALTAPAEPQPEPRRRRLFRRQRALPATP